MKLDYTGSRFRIYSQNVLFEITLLTIKITYWLTLSFFYTEYNWEQKRDSQLQSRKLFVQNHKCWHILVKNKYKD